MNDSDAVTLVVESRAHPKYCNYMTFFAGMLTITAIETRSNHCLTLPDISAAVQLLQNSVNAKMFVLKINILKKVFAVILSVTDTEKCKIYQNRVFFGGGGAICSPSSHRSSGILLFGQDLIITHLRCLMQTDRKG